MCCSAVCRVRGLLAKGKNGMFFIDRLQCILALSLYYFVLTNETGTNDAFVTISLGKEKFQTSVKQKSSPDLEWQEECEL